MTLNRCFAGFAGLLGLGTCLTAQAQSPLAATISSPPTELPGLALASFAAAHDSLMHRVANVRAQAEAHIVAFKTVQGSLGGLHRRVKCYAGVPEGVVNAVGFRSVSVLVKDQSIRHVFGIELEKVVYRDAKGRKVLTERYEGHQLTRLELVEYSTLNMPSAGWLLVRGDYLRYMHAPISIANQNSRKISYFFRPRPAAE